MRNTNFIDGLGTISIRAIESDYPRPMSSSIYSNWGEMAPDVPDMAITRWLIVLSQPDEVAVGDMSARAAIAG